VTRKTEARIRVLEAKLAILESQFARIEEGLARRAQENKYLQRLVEMIRPEAAARAENMAAPPENHG
jgi:uncharacterized coiled-coil protein SlyX